MGSPVLLRLDLQRLQLLLGAVELEFQLVPLVQHGEQLAFAERSVRGLVHIVDAVRGRRAACFALLELKVTY